MTRLKRGEELSQTRVGMCCGKLCRASLQVVPLWLVPGHGFRYRCEDCYKLETGLTPPPAVQS